ncbi:MAG: adenine methyltransferase, partial [Chitinivibrionia bacterium]|nr:adenine methyltransferase [Chitinivibrionia bacterium]
MLINLRVFQETLDHAIATIAWSFGAFSFLRNFVDSTLAAQHSTAQHSTAQHSTAQHSTAQHSTAQH